MEFGMGELTIDSLICFLQRWASSMGGSTSLEVASF